MTHAAARAQPWLRPDLRSRSLSGLLAGLARRTLALALLVLLAVPMLLIAAIIVARDGAPVFFAHYRVGRDGRLFRCLKFRSMRRDAEDVLGELLRTDDAARQAWQRDHKLPLDPRITPFGRFLRRSSLDELPQLFNILRGEMAFVGPRPITVEELTRYGADRWHYLSVHPGVTGLWQVSGRNNITYEARVALDRFYVERKSPLFDLAIMLKTVRAVLTRDGAN